jgi:MFS family permease
VGRERLPSDLRRLPLLAGRLGDLYGHKRLFLIGIALFTAASLACGLSTTQGMLVGARAIQGFGGAVVAAVALSLIMTLFTEPGDRAKGMGVFGFVAAGGGTVGVLVLLGLGAGIAFNPMLLAAMGDVEQSEAGLASGVVNTSFMMGGALGLAILASLATSRTNTLLAAGEDQLAALNGGYHLAFLVGAIFAVGAAAIGGTLLRPQVQGAHAEAPDAIGPPAIVEAD